MNQERFWRIIEEVISKYQGTKESYLDELTYQLEKLSLTEVVLWDNYFEAYLQLAEKEKLWAGAFIINKGDCNEDGFTDFRCWLISMGKDYYFDIMAQVDDLADLIVKHPENFSAKFEEIIYSGQEVFISKVKRDASQPDRDPEALYFDYVNNLALGAEVTHQLALELALDKNINFSWNENSTKRFKRELPKLCQKYLGYLNKYAMKYEISVVNTEFGEG